LTATRDDVAVHAGIGARHARPDRVSASRQRCRLHGKIGVQRQRQGAVTRRRNADAVAHLEAVIGRVERDRQVVVDHWRAAAPMHAGPIAAQRRPAGKRASTLANACRMDQVLIRVYSQGVQALGPTFSEEMSITYV
jgi:hypothetical protein